MIVIFLVSRVNIINLDYRFYIYLIELRVKNDMITGKHRRKHLVLNVSFTVSSLFI